MVNIHTDKNVYTWHDRKRWRRYADSIYSHIKVSVCGATAIQKKKTFLHTPDHLASSPNSYDFAHSKAICEPIVHGPGLSDSKEKQFSDLSFAAVLSGSQRPVYVSHRRSIQHMTR